MKRPSWIGGPDGARGSRMEEIACVALLRPCKVVVLKEQRGGDESIVLGRCQ